MSARTLVVEAVPHILRERTGPTAVRFADRHDARSPMTSRKRERPEFKPQDLPGELPILPLRNSVFFPGAVMPLTIGRAKTIRLIEEATRENSLLGIVTQRAPEID